MSLDNLRAPENRIGLAVDADDNVYLTGIGVVFKRPPGGPLQVVAGSSGDGPLDGTGSAARFAYPGPSAIASGWTYTTGGAYILDLLANQVRHVDFTTGAVTTAGGKVTPPLAPGSFHPNYGTSPGTGTFSRFHRPRGAAFSLNAMVVTEGHTIRYGGPEIDDRAVIDDGTGGVGLPRQLDTFPQTATSWTWSVIRRPAGSTATLSSTNVRNPTFTPDIADLYVFRCVATSSTGSSISTVMLQGSASAVALELVGYPGPIPANAEFPLTVSAKDPFGNLAASYAGTVHFTSSDPSATLPGDYTFTAGDNGWRHFNATLRTPGTQSITVTDVADGSLVATIHLTVVLPAPTGFVATATSPTSIELTWNASFGASTYQIAPWNGIGYSPTISGLTTTSFTFSATPGASYAFRVRAVDDSANTSSYSNADAATTIFFTGDPLAAGDTVLLVHLTEARQAIDAMRDLAVLAPLSYTDPSPVAGVTPIRGAHISELRTGLNEARTKLQLLSTSFTDPTLSSAVPVKAVHMQEVLNAVK